MKKKVLLYLTVLSGALSLQSCVSNYVVSKPIIYKTDAKLAKISPEKLVEAKKELTNSDKINSALASIEAGTKASETTNNSKHNKIIDGILAEAETYLGTPYRFGGMSRNGIDCSAFVLSAYSAAGISLPRVAASQAIEGERVERENLQKGDLLFFSQGGGRISHVAMVYEVTEDGEVKFIHSSSSKGVSFSSLNSSYWAPKFRMAKRIITDNAESRMTAMN